MTPGLPGAPVGFGSPAAPQPLGAPAPGFGSSQQEDEDLLPAVLPTGKPARAMTSAPAAAPPPRPASSPDLPAVGPRAGRGGSGDFDLPALPAELPSPARGGGRGARAVTSTVALDEPDLGSDLPAMHSEFGSDLPAMRPPGSPPARPGSRNDRQITGGALFDDLDLPSNQSSLPAVRADLPAPRDVALPAIKGGQPARSAQGGGFGEIDLPLVARHQGGEPAGEMDAFGDMPDPMDFPPMPVDHGADLSGFDEPIDFSPRVAPSAPPPAPPPFGGPTEEDDPFGAPPAAMAAGLQRKSGGGTNFGEVDLGGDEEPPPPLPPPVKPPPAKAAPPAPPPAPPARSAADSQLGWGERDLGEESGTSGDDDMEFGAIPQEKKADGEGKPVPPPSARSKTSAPLPQNTMAEPIGKARQGAEVQVEPRGPGKAIRVMAGVLLVVGLGGGALFMTPYGAFGYLLVQDTLNAKKYEQAEASLRQEIRQRLARDTASAANEAMALAEAAHNQSPRANGVSSLAAYVAFLKELRFGHDSAEHAHAAGVLGTVPTDLDLPVIGLARAAQAAASEQLARGQSLAEALVRRTPEDPEAVGLATEIAIEARAVEHATEHSKKLSEIEQSPRSFFSVARAQLLKKDRAAAEASAKKVIVLEPNHAGARLLLARMAWEQPIPDEAAATEHLAKILKDPATQATAGREDLVAAYSLQGAIHLRRSRVSAAEASFNEALKLNPKASAALNGLGEALYRAGRHSEALARFGSAMEADPEAIEPKIGVAKTKLALERLQESKELLRGLSKKLKEENHPSFQVLYWQGRASEALGDKAAAEADYNEGIKLAGVDGDIIDTYVSLAQLLTSLGRPVEAQAKLDEARTKLPKSVTLYKALGDLASQAGRYTEAEASYQQALQMDPQDISTRFKLAIVLRRLSKFDAANDAFDKVAAADKDYPALSLERAVLYESSGQSAKAIEGYQAALDKAPNDPDLMLRVAAAQLATNQPTQIARAEELLRKVMQLRQNSAEANHFLGRALLMKGTNLAEALRNLRRAADLDPNRAEYWLYVGWAANEADDQGLAADSLKHALDLDRSLADAYWQRGVLRRRQRNVGESEQDLLKALELRPSRFEAYATLAEVYEDQQKWPQALASWQKAIAADSTRAVWQFRLGKLMSQNNNRAGALEHLTAAVQLASQMQAPPAWLADACLLLADAERVGNKKDLAIEHYQRFLSLAPPDSPYRNDAEKALKTLGANR
jgi:tetratricopeptide (TPR) repeat protein